MVPLRWEVNVTGEFARWYASLSEAETDSVIAVVEMLEEDGPTLARPHADTVKGSRYANLKKLRPRAAGKFLRILFMFDPRREAILLLGGSKENAWHAWYPPAIRRAESLYESYLAELRTEGELGAHDEAG